MSDDEDAVEISQEDFKYFKKRSMAASFLIAGPGEMPKRRENLDEKKRRKKERKEREEAAAEADDAPRQSKAWSDAQTAERRTGLPLKMADGTVKRVMRDTALPEADPDLEYAAPLSDRQRKKVRDRNKKTPEQIAKEEAAAEAEEEAKREALRAEKEALRAEELRQNEQTPSQKRLAIADLAMSIMRDPQKNISGLKSLLDNYCSDRDLLVAKLGILSTTAVLCDICPSYRIRPPTDKEKEMKVSKEVAAQRAYESGILHGYQRFLQVLEAAGRRGEDAALALEQAGDGEGLRGSMLMVSVTGMARLLRKNLHFNFSKNIMQSMVRRVDSPIAAVRQVALEALHGLFKESGLSDAVKDAVLLLADMVKKKTRNVRPEVLECFLEIRITNDMLDGGSAKHKKSERDAEEEEMERDLEEGNATMKKADRKRLATAILDAILVCYFRVLKLDPVAPPHLLPPVLKGLARFAHLINIDFFSDLLQAIKALVLADATGECALTPASAIHCVSSVFKCLKNQGEVWDLDLQDFFDALFQAVPRLAVDPAGAEDVGILAEALRLCLYDIRQLSSDRVAGFVKRVLALALHVPPACAAALMALTRLLLTRYPRCVRLLDTEHACVGVYNSDVANAELSNALASTGWELHLLRRSFHPAARRAAGEVAGMGSEDRRDDELFRNMVSVRAPDALLREYDASRGGFAPAIQLPTPHPLRMLLARRARKNARKGATGSVRDYTLFVAPPERPSKFLGALSGAGRDRAAPAPADESMHGMVAALRWFARRAPATRAGAAAGASVTEKKIKAPQLAKRNGGRAGGGVL